MKLNTLDWLQFFYKSLCDGDWEHTYGIKINTLDNPGWRVKIDLAETFLQKKSFKKIRIERTDEDWLFCWLENMIFNIACGPKNLTEGIETFKEWVEGEGKL